MKYLFNSIQVKQKRAFVPYSRVMRKCWQVMTRMIFTHLPHHGSLAKVKMTIPRKSLDTSAPKDLLVRLYDMLVNVAQRNVEPRVKSIQVLVSIKYQLKSQKRTQKKR